MSGIAFTNASDGLTRSGSFINPATSWTRTGWFQITTSFVDFKTLFLYGDVNYVAPYVWLGTDHTGAVTLETYDGATYTDQTSGVLTLGDWNSWAAVYNSGSHQLSFYVNDALISTITVNFSTFVFSATTEFAGNEGGSQTNDAITQFRTWQTAKALANLRQEWQSQTVVSATSLLAATPLTGPSDLTDTSGNGRNWSTVGGAGSSVAGPYPSNNLAAGATTLTLDTPVTQRCDVGGIALNAWFQYTAPADGVLSLWMYGAVDVFRPNAEVFLSPGTTTHYMAVGGGGSTHSLCPPFQFPVRSGETYLFKANNINTINSVPANLTVLLRAFAPAALPIPIESICINDDAGRVARGDGTFDTFPISILSGSDSYAALKYVPSFPTGETGDIMENGVVCVGGDDDNSFTKTIFIYTYDATAGTFTLVTSNDLTSIARNFNNMRANRSNGKFYLLYQITDFHHRIARISQAGVVEFSTSNLATWTSSIASMTTSLDGTIAYFADAHATARIGRWDMIGDVALSDLVSIPGAVFGRDMVTLADGSVIVILNNATTGQIRRYSDAGVLLNTYTPASLGIDYINSLADSRIAASSDGTKFWYRNLSNEDANGFLGSYFIKIDADSGAVVKRILAAPFSIGEFLSDPINTSAFPTFFGHSESCTFFITPGFDMPSCEGGGEITVVADPPDGTPFTGRNQKPRAWLVVNT
jgi:hypothetical protein